MGQQALLLLLPQHRQGKLQQRESPRSLPYLSHNQRSQPRLKQPPLRLGGLLDGLPHPLLVIGQDHAITYVNTAAEDFFQMSAGVLCRSTLPDVVAFGSPLVALVEQVERHGTTVNEYGVELGSFRFEAPKLVEVRE